MDKETRPSWDEYFMSITKLVATRATCPRLRVGAIIVKDKRILTTGYNGSLQGLPHCDEIGCLVIKGHCRRTIHAELNAILQATSTGVKINGADMYCLYFPCLECIKEIIRVGIKKVIYKKDYKRHKGEQKEEYEATRQMAKDAGLELVKLKEK